MTAQTARVAAANAGKGKGNAFRKSVFLNRLHRILRASWSKPADRP
ncbi:unknown protein [Parachlamydia acanthamoebae UV-7]|uniref:Uncharacterized protein n=1 Tax=Parachlamydia acanthamoebae (strain UV7) TaxID=765952 RepID=F8KXT1_PARAV|nr:unknown protein [Parachlamydia acanthamoebae UV-7]